MIYSIEGIITYKDAHCVHVVVHGIEYMCLVTHYTSRALGVVGEKNRILTHVHYSDDGINLYGFYTEKERDLFFALIKISGVGRKQAIKILSGMHYDEFIIAISREDLGALQQISGLGKKTAQKIILALHGSLKLEDAIQTDVDDMTANMLMIHEVTQSLVDMGFEKKRARDTVMNLCNSCEGEQELLKQAIMHLSAG